MAETEKTGRPNQRRRTRKDLLEAASRLMRQGAKPSLEEIAEEALVSRATAYRYFPSVEALWFEASFDVAIPEADELFRESPADDPVSRLEQVDATLHDVTLANETALRMMLAYSLQRGLKGEPDGEIPPRQNRRSPLIAAALEPARDRFEPEALETLSRALALLIGPEALIVCEDVLQLSDADARAVKRWAIRTLVEAALRENSGG